MKITNEVLEAHLICKTKGRLKLAGQAGTISDYEAMLSAAKAASREQALARLVARFPAAQRSVPVTAALLKKGLPLLVDGTLEDEGMSICFDALKRADEASQLGHHHYLPVLHVHGERVGKREKVLLALYGLVLAGVQGHRPAVGLVARGAEGQLGKVGLNTNLYRKAQQVLDEVKQIQTGCKTPVLTLNDHCVACEFRSRCHAEAVQKDDLSLLRVMSESELRQHRGKGIFTVTQLSYTFRPRRKGKRSKGKDRPHHAALQALAIRDAKTYAVGKPEVPCRPVRVYLDLEGDADGSFVYLLGALVVRDGVATMHSFWADGPGDEDRLLRQLLEAVGGEDFDMLHFGSYERKFLMRMRRRARRKGPVDRLLANSVDVLSLVRSNVYFPIYSNGLKEIARHLGFAWSDAEACGLQSLVWRRRWEQTGDDSLRHRLVAYNAEDCAALRLITEHLDLIAAGFDGDSETAGEPRLFERVGAGKRGSDFHKWGHTTFLLPEFQHASRCAWFDYQREKVAVRKQTGKAGVRASPRKKPRLPRPTKRVEVRGNRCPGCKAWNVCQARSPRKVKYFVDLRVSAGGVRRVVIRYAAARYRCRDCGRYFFPRKFRDLPRFGHALKCWVIYQHIANRTSFQNLERTLKECFGLEIYFADLYRFKIELARRYRKTYQNILHKIIAGSLLHADETGVQFKKDKGYVWAFANLENVVYMCRPSREADFLAPLLKGFSGVLVSDFYKGYDSLPCPQQKCLVHLIRDLNGDLQASIHDEEFKDLAKAFGALLVKIVATIDRHGLRRERLQRHKVDVDTFFQRFCGKTFQSEVAEGYRMRFLSYREKLFTFLDHDGVPWHNNNAEHAIKHFAKYRMITNGRVTANGLQPYLVLLSIYQTCVYKKVNFLRFLLSGEQDVDALRQVGRRRQAHVPRHQPEGEAESGILPAAADAGNGELAAVGLAAQDSAPGSLDLAGGEALGLPQMVRAAIAEIVQKVVAGEDDPCLRWGPGRRRVRVLVKRAFCNRGERGPALHVALETNLKAMGWIWAPGRVLHTYERCRTGDALAEAAGFCLKQDGVNDSDGTAKTALGSR